FPFLFTAPSPTEILPLSLHDALPICPSPVRGLPVHVEREMKKSILRTLLCTLPLLGATALSAQKAYNTLTTEEAASGYTLLFNGTDLTGWRGWNNMTPPVSWVVVAETTWNVFRTGPGGQAPLVTVDSTYQNFDLKLEFNVPSQGNSGIFIRYNQY